MRVTNNENRGRTGFVCDLDRGRAVYVRRERLGNNGRADCAKGETVPETIHTGKDRTFKKTEGEDRVSMQQLSVHVSGSRTIRGTGGGQRVQGGSIETIPEQPGISVHFNGHTGIYIGNGQVVEARGTFYGVGYYRTEHAPVARYGENNRKSVTAIGEVKKMILQKGMKDNAKGGSPEQRSASGKNADAKGDSR